MSNGKVSINPKQENNEAVGSFPHPGGALPFLPTSFIKKMEHSTKQDNRPAFQFYPDDWKAEDGLKLCSLAAKGLWIEMLMIMFKSKVRGCLLVNEKQIRSKELAKLTSNNEPEIEILLTELEQYNVYSRLKSGCIYCRRMYREALHEKEISEKRSKAGKLGGRPPKSKKETKKAASSPSPSSSPSSSSNINTYMSEKMFNTVWNKYPSKGKVGKKKAFRYYSSSVQTKETYETINKALDKYLKSERVQKGYIQNAPTWFNNWADWVEYNEGRKERIKYD